MKLDVKKRIVSRVKVHPITACWEWRGARMDGYGVISLGRKALRVHRVAYKLWIGAITQAKPVICHRCDNRACCNPWHLFPGTVADNNLDCNAKGRHPNSVRKLNHEQVKEIRDSTLPLEHFVNKYGLTSNSIWKIRNRVSYRDV